MRPDLALLVDDVLIDLANKGLVKRAHKLVGKGEPTVSWDGVVPTGTFSDGVVSSLPPDTGLADSPCSCAASGICRHRLALVIACRTADVPASEVADGWVPAFSDGDLDAVLGATLVARAERHQAGVVVELVPGPPPTASLPTCTVRFLVEGELGYASCDCDEPKCEHIAHAVWAFRRGGERVELAPSKAVVDTGPLDELVALTDDVLWAGVSRSHGQAQRLARVQRSLDRAKLTWPLEACEALGEQLTAYAARSARYVPAALAEVLVDPWARRTTLGSGGTPDAAVLGSSVARETRLEKARFIGLGLRVRALDEGSLVEVFLAESRSGSVLVQQRELAPGADGERVTGAGVRRRKGGGVAFHRLATGRILTQVARRRANRALVLGAGVGNTSATAGKWSDLPAALLGFGPSDVRPPGLRPRHLAGRVRVLEVDEVASVGWDPAEQAVVGQVLVGEELVRVVLTHSGVTPGACAALVEAIEAGPKRISGHLSRAGGAWQIEPLAVEVERIRVLALADAAPVRSQVVAEVPAPSALARASSHALSLLDEVAHDGLASASAGWSRRLESAATELTRVGLAASSARLQSVVIAARNARASGERAEVLVAWRRAWIQLAAVVERV